MGRRVGVLPMSSRASATTRGNIFFVAGRVLQETAPLVPLLPADNNNNPTTRNLFICVDASTHDCRHRSSLMQDPASHRPKQNIRLLWGRGPQAVQLNKLEPDAVLRSFFVDTNTTRQVTPAVQALEVKYGYGHCTAKGAVVVVVCVCVGGGSTSLSSLFRPLHCQT